MSLAELAVLAIVASRILAAAQMFVGAAQLFAHESSALDRLAPIAAMSGHTAS